MERCVRVSVILFFVVLTALLRHAVCGLVVVATHCPPSDIHLSLILIM